MREDFLKEKNKVYLKEKIKNDCLKRKNANH